MSKTNLTYSEHTKEEVGRARTRTRTRTRTRRKRRAWCGTRDRVAKLLFLLSTPMNYSSSFSNSRSAPSRRPKSSSKIQRRHPNTLDVAYVFQSRFYPLGSSFSAKDVDKVSVVKKTAFVSVRTRTGRSVFPSVQILSRHVFGGGVFFAASSVLIILAAVALASSATFSAFSFAFEVVSATVSSTRPFRIASSARTANLWNVFEFANASTRNSFRT